MIIDFHTHIFSKKIRENREKYFLSELAFKLLYRPPKSKLVGVSDIIHSMDEQCVDKSVVFGFPWKNSDIFRKENDYILDKLAPLFEICCEKDLPALIHANEPVGHIYPGKTPITLNQIYKLIKRFPENKIVLAHWGGGIFLYNILKKEVKESLKNVYFDTAASPFLYDPEVYRLAIKFAGPDKILFGSDFPLIKPARYFKEMKEAGLTEVEMESICGKNAANLLKV
jgi:predicted TIM-barrel fold metal-dependent hydrolase